MCPNVSGGDKLRHDHVKALSSALRCDTLLIPNILNQDIPLGALL
jgi:hypothetical protein